MTASTTATSSSSSLSSSLGSAAAASSSSSWCNSSCLPDLVLSLIFRHSISINTDIDRCGARQGIRTLANYSLVCKQWHRLINRERVEDACLWRDLAMQLSPCFSAADFRLDRLLFWEGKRPSWRSACKLHSAWSKAFLSTDQKPQPELCEELSELALPPVPKGCHRHFIMAIGGPHFAIQQRHAGDLSDMASAVISFDYDGSISILSAYRDAPYLLGCYLFWDMDGECTTSGHCVKAMHLRKICRSRLPLIFEAQVKGLTVVAYDDNDDNKDDSSDDNDDNGDVAPSTSLIDIHGDEVIVSSCNICVGSTSGNDVHGHHSNCADAYTERGHRDDKEECELGQTMAVGADNDCNNSNQCHCCNEECETVHVVHNVDGNLDCDLWVVFDEPFKYTYWQKLLVYIPWKSPGYSSSIVKCVKAGVDGTLLWCVDIDGAPRSLEVNSQFVAVVADVVVDVNSVVSKLILLDIQNGHRIQSVDMEFTMMYGLLLTDTILLVSQNNLFSRGRNVVTVYELPNLQPLYALPSYNEARLSYMALSPNGRFLGVSTYFGDLTIYDMLTGKIKYVGSNGMGPPTGGKRQVGDGVWIWYQDFKLGHSKQQTVEKIVYWQLKDPDARLLKLRDRQ